MCAIVHAKTVYDTQTKTITVTIEIKDVGLPDVEFRFRIRSGRNVERRR